MFASNYGSEPDNLPLATHCGTTLHRYGKPAQIDLLLVRAGRTLACLFTFYRVISASTVTSPSRRATVAKFGC